MTPAAIQETCVLPPFRGPSVYQASGQYYDVLNHFFSDGTRIRRYARFKRIGDKRGWGAPETKEGLELDRSRFLYDWKISQVGARLDDLVKDGCEIVSYKKQDAPSGMVTYILVSWPTNRELEKNRAARTARKQPRQEKLPRDVAPFQHPNPRITAERQEPTLPAVFLNRVATDREGRPRPVMPERSTTTETPSLFEAGRP
jgi:hypothetical protein